MNWDDSTHFLELSATDTADAAQFTGFDDVIGEANGNLETSAIVRWPSSGGLTWNTTAQNDSPEIKDIIQEIVDKHGELSVGESILIWVKSPDLNSNSEVMAADLGHADFNTTLEIDFEYEE